MFTVIQLDLFGREEKTLASNVPDISIAVCISEKHENSIVKNADGCTVYQNIDLPF